MNVPAKALKKAKRALRILTKTSNVSLTSGKEFVDEFACSGLSHKRWVTLPIAEKIACE
jgi:hypothetical protein